MKTRTQKLILWIFAISVLAIFLFPPDRYSGGKFDGWFFIGHYKWHSVYIGFLLLELFGSALLFGSLYLAGGKSTDGD